MNVNEFIYGPVMADFWSHRDLIDGVFDIDDLLDAHEMLHVRNENENRAFEATQQRREV